jgi:E3 ubiquitin-protein ligase RAD18
MKEQAVDRHLDTSCPGSPPDPKQAQPNPVIDLTSAFPQAPTSRAKPIQPPPERLPSLSYSLLKDTALRKKMSELGLPTTGGRSLLELRHKEWIMLWNANCDSARPKKRSELLRDLDVWERTLGGRAQYGSFSGSSAAAQVKDKDFDGIAWASKHDDSFKALIANAKRSRSQAQKGSEEKEDSPGGSGDQQVNGVITGSLDKSSSQDAHNEVTDGVTTFPDARAAMIHGPDGGQSGEGDQVTRSSEPETPQFLTGDVIPSSSQLEVDMPLPQSSAVS